MATTTEKSAFLRGARTGTLFIIAVVPFAALFGVVATEAGLSIAETMGFTALVIAGAAQFAALSQLAENAPVMVVIATALAVNLRMAMYSASLAVYIGAAPLWQRLTVAYVNFDQTYSMSVSEYERHPEMSVGERVAFLLGTAAPIVPCWIAGTYAGAVLGGQIPDAIALDFALPIMFLAVVAPMLKTLAHVAAATVSVVAALALTWVPNGLGLLIAAALAMVTGATVELLMERRQR